MDPSDVTIEILRRIREGVEGTNQRVDAVSERLDVTNERIDVTNERLESMRDELSRRIVESELRTSTAITGLAGSVHDLTCLLRAQHDLRPRVEACERDIAELRRIVGKS